MDEEQRNKLLFIWDRCNDTQRDIKHLQRLMYMLHIAFRENGFEGNEYGESISYLIDRLLEMIEKEYLEPMENEICELGGFKKVKNDDFQ